MVSGFKNSSQVSVIVFLQDELPPQKVQDSLILQVTLILFHYLELNVMEEQQGERLTFLRPLVRSRFVSDTSNLCLTIVAGQERFKKYPNTLTFRLPKCSEDSTCCVRWVKTLFVLYPDI